VFSVKIQVEGDFGAALREAWQRRNEIESGCEVVKSPEQEEKGGAAASSD